MKRIVKIGIWTICIMAAICIALLLICNHIVVSNAKGKVFSELDSIAPTEWGEEPKDDFWRCINSVLGHNEQDTIAGNFTGKGIDTLYVSYDLNKEDDDKWQFYAESPNKNIPKINLWGFRGAFPKLVNEGDLDGNGTCEVGYLHTWMNSQWRTYRVFTLLDGKWYYLINPKHVFMETSEHFRQSKKEILEPSEKTGWIKVNYETQGIGAMLKDTIVKPDYSPIED